MGLKAPRYTVLGLLILGIGVMIMYTTSSVPQWAGERTRLQVVVCGFSLANNIAWMWSQLTGAHDLLILRYMVDLVYTDYFTDYSQGMKFTETKLDGVPVQIFRPDGTQDNSPAIVYIHGGGWTLFTADSYKPTTYHMARKYNVVVVSVDYRLAPEHPYPVPFDDCVKATVYLLKNARKLGIDPNRIAIAGDSAGGNLAAAVALRLSQEDLASQLPRLKFQVLIYPALQMLDLNTYSYQAFDKTAWLDQAVMIKMWLSYLGASDLQTQLADFAANNHTSPLLEKSPHGSYLKLDNLPKELRIKGVQPVTPKKGDDSLAARLAAKALDPYFTPLLAPDVSKVPPAYVIIAHNDVLRDDGFLYVERLQKAGVRTEVDYHKTMAHGFCLLSFSSMLTFQGGVQAFDNLAPYVKKHL